MTFRDAYTSPVTHGHKVRSFPPLLPDGLLYLLGLDGFLDTSFIADIDGWKLRFLPPEQDDSPGGFHCCVSYYSGSVLTSAAQSKCSSMELNFAFTLATGLNWVVSRPSNLSRPYFTASVGNALHPTLLHSNAGKVNWHMFVHSRRHCSSAAACCSMISYPC